MHQYLLSFTNSTFSKLPIYLLLFTCFYFKAKKTLHRSSWKYNTYFLSFSYSWCHIFEIIRFHLFQRILLSSHITIATFNLHTCRCIFIPWRPVFYFRLNIRICYKLILSAGKNLSSYILLRYMLNIISHT